MLERKTKIIITLGPSTQKFEIVLEFIKCGVEVFRLNFSHGDHRYHKKNIELIRKASDVLKIPVTILQDLSGPKLRIGELKEPFWVHVGELVEIYKHRVIGEKVDRVAKLSIDHPEILKNLKEGSLIYISDGTIRLKVKEVLKEKIIAEVIQGGVISSHKGINFPGTELDIPAFTEKDKNDLMFGLKHGVDLVALSFVQKKEDILECKKMIKQFGSNQWVFAKIETKKALENIDEILEVSDGIMIARGDLGVEIPIEKVPIVQKELTRKAKNLGKPVIIATQMLTSMIHSVMPTRADISDIANAVLDGADALMLSDETAIGEFPLECVEMMIKTIKEAEKIYPYLTEDPKNVPSDFAIAYSSCILARELGAKAIVVFTKSGSSALRVARFRPEVPIIANVHDPDILKLLKIVWGVNPYLVISEKEDSEKMIKEFVKKAYQDKIISLNDTLVLTIGYPAGIVGSTNMIRILKPDLIRFLLDKED